MVRRLVLVLLLGLGAALPGCGGSSGATHGSSGRALFAQACGACHTLTGHNDPRHQGGDLLGFHATRAQFLQFAAEMPVRRPLSEAQLEAVVRFVRRVQGARS